MPLSPERWHTNRKHLSPLLPIIPTSPKCRPPSKLAEPWTPPHFIMISASERPVCCRMVISLTSLEYVFRVYSHADIARRTQRQVTLVDIGPIILREYQRNMSSKNLHGVSLQGVVPRTLSTFWSSWTHTHHGPNHGGVGCRKQYETALLVHPIIPSPVRIPMDTYLEPSMLGAAKLV